VLGAMPSSPAASSCSGWLPKLAPKQYDHKLPSYERTSAAKAATAPDRSPIMSCWPTFWPIRKVACRPSRCCGGSIAWATCSRQSRPS
jgi:hypothetical protein